MSSALLSRLAFAVRAGLSFGGQRDYYEVFGYKRRLTFEDMVAKYERQDVAKRIVDAPAAGIWRNPPKVDGGQAFNTAWEELTKSLRVWNQLEKADKLSGLGRYSILFVGYDDGGAPESPVLGGSERTVLYLQPYGESNAVVDKLVDNPSDPRFGLPLSYKISVADPKTQTNLSSTASVRQRSSKTITVHHTRIVHVHENSLEDPVYGTPRILPVFNLLDDLLKVAGGTAETFWLTANRGLTANVDKDMELDTDDAKELSDEIEEYQHQLRRFIRTRGVEVKSLGSDVPRPKESFDVIISLISGSTGIPKRILIGSEAGQLSSEQDRANWAERLEERQTSFAEPIVLLPFVESLQAAGALPEADLEVEWPDTFKMNPLEDAQMMAQKARAASNLSKTSATGQILSLEETRELLGYDPEFPTDGTLLKTQPGEEEDEEDDPNEIERQRLEDEDDEGGRQRAATTRLVT